MSIKTDSFVANRFGYGVLGSSVGSARDRETIWLSEKHSSRLRSRTRSQPARSFQIAIPTP